jgi:hypothetical protein
VEITDEGVEEAFDVVAEISDRQVMLAEVPCSTDCIFLSALRRRNG